MVMYRNKMEKSASAKAMYREYVHSVAVYQKYLTRLGKLTIFEPWRENYHSSQPCKIFLIYHNTMYVSCLSFNVLFVQFYNFELRKKMNLAVYGNRLAVLVTS